MEEVPKFWWELAPSSRDGINRVILHYETEAKDVMWVFQLPEESADHLKTFLLRQQEEVHVG